MTLPERDIKIKTVPDVQDSLGQARSNDSDMVEFQHFLRAVRNGPDYGVIASGLQRRLLAQSVRRKSGGACPLRPSISDIDLFRYCQGVIYFDAQISDGAFDLGVPEQKLDRPEISGAPINQGRFGSSQ